MFLQILLLKCLRIAMTTEHKILCKLYFHGEAKITFDREKNTIEPTHLKTSTLFVLPSTAFDDLSVLVLLYVI